MKSFKVLVIITLLTLCACPALAQKATEKIGFVDLSRLFDDYYKTKDYDKVLEAKHNEFEKERNVKVEQIQDSIRKLGLLKDDKKAELEDGIEQMKAELLEYDRQKKADLTKERNEKIRDILLEIENKVSEYAEKQSFSIILNDRVLIYGNQTMDLTEEILTILNESQPK